MMLGLGGIRKLHRAICRLDESTIRRLVPTSPDKPEVFWAGVHKARAELGNATAAQKAESLAWLAERGVGPLHLEEKEK